ncbi:MAG: hypothetical protein K6V97_06565 [Actinomycetia bacterium]|jgi:hypothetical protein|nr:hypothetical protein [Actinomycetes bacterium]
MQFFGLIVDSAEEAEAAVDRLWNQLRVRGEIQVRRLDGKFKIDVIAERDLSAAQLEKLPGKRT